VLAAQALTIADLHLPSARDLTRPG